MEFWYKEAADLKGIKAKLKRQVEAEISKISADRFTTFKMVLDNVCVGLQAIQHIKGSASLWEVINHL